MHFCTFPELDVFYVSLEPDSPFDYFSSSGVAGSFVTDITQDMVRSRLEQLEELVRRQLKLLFSDTGAEIHRVTALPTRTEEGRVIFNILVHLWEAR